MCKKYSRLETTRIVVVHESFLVGSIVEEQIHATDDTPVVVDELQQESLDFYFEL